jgi:hypothetical protein
VASGREVVYCIDTSALIYLRSSYPPRIARGLWKALEGLVSLGRLVAPDEVRREVHAKDDELSEWAKDNGEMFRPHDEELVRQVQGLLKEFRELASLGFKRYQADPWVIALAMSMNDMFREGVGVTLERRGGLHKIPDVCDRVGLRCLDIFGLFEEEGWQLTVGPGG